MFRRWDGTGPKRLYETNIKGHTMNRLSNRHAQNIIEYAIVVALVTAAVAAMSTYVFRSVQATQKAVDTGFAQ
jgi:hypothetical protein